MKHPRVTKAVVPAAGYATRFLPVSKAMPKQMLPIIDKPVIQYVIEQLVEAGIQDIIIITNYHERAIEDHFDKPHGDLIENLKMGGPKKKPLLDAIERVSDLANFVYIRQKGPYGNGTPLMNVRHIIGDEPFVYTWSDEFFIAKPNAFQQVIDVYNEYGVSTLGCIEAKHASDYERFGFIGGERITENVLSVQKMIEKPGKHNAPSNMATISPFVFTPDIFQYIDKAVKDSPNGAELYWNDIAKLMIEDNKKIYGVRLQNADYCDSGTPLSYLKTVIRIALHDPEIGPELKSYLQTIDRSV